MDLKSLFHYKNMNFKRSFTLMTYERIDTYM
jgi:hypothetical protein